MRNLCPILLSLIALTSLRDPCAAGSFTNFESHQIHPLDLTPDGTRLLACNTPDNRLSVFRLTATGAELSQEICVGLEPVSVRARSDSEAWVVNHLSDAISIVDLTTGNVRATLEVGDEPTDVVFAGTPERAFVCLSQEDAIKIYDPNDLGAAPVVVPIFGSDPRALARSADGRRVYAAVFESGNRTSILSIPEVQAGGGPPPLVPPLAADLPPPPESGLIIFWTGTHWLDETGARNWDELVSIPYTLPDYDVAELDADAALPTPRYFSGVGTLNFNLTVNPATGLVYVANIESFNLTRFEPVLNGRFAQNRLTRIDPATGTARSIHLNPHINYDVSPGPPEEAAQSLSQVNGGDWDAAGETLYLASLGTGQLAVIDRSGIVLDRVEVGEGPTAAVVDDARSRVYVLNRFTNTLALVSTTTRSKASEVTLGFQPEPGVITEGRKFLYDARLTSAHGDLACATCHAFGHFDNLVWDLGNPRGALEATPTGNTLFHPVKGPMSTQTLRGLPGTNPLHWRGDRADFTRFNPAFIGLMGRDDSLSTADMLRFTEFVMTLAYPPNPYQRLDRTYPTSGVAPGNAERGRREFVGPPRDGPLRCQDCHQSAPIDELFQVAPGTTSEVISRLGLPGEQLFKIPQLRVTYEKTGWTDGPGPQKRGFGLNHDGTIDNAATFLLSPAFQFTSSQQRKDLEAFLLCFDTGMAPAVGRQQTVNGGNRDDAAVTTRIELLLSRAAAGDIDLVVKGRQNGIARGWLLEDGLFRSDRAQEPPLAASDLRGLAADGSELTFTGVPPGNGARIGVDRDCDGWRDRDEIDLGSNPADAASFPDTTGGGPPRPFDAILRPPGTNPMPPAGTTLSFTLAAAGEVSLQLFDAQGRLVRTLLPRSRQQGTVTLDWNGTDERGRPVRSGLYFYRLEAHGSAGPRVIRTERVVVAR